LTVHSAGILLYRMIAGEAEVFLVHPGGPYWTKKDEGAWSIPKGIANPQEDYLAAAQREFREETGFAPDGDFLPLGSFRQPSGKQLTVWALEGNCDPAKLVSNNFSTIWPPKTGTLQMFPEVDRGAWFKRDEAMVRIAPGQRQIIERFYDHDVIGRYG
jgi:predicted NUDIX family NTP pyrophosphohydrolase